MVVHTYSPSYSGQSAARGALGGGAAGLDLHFGQFDIPVAIVVPHATIFIKNLHKRTLRIVCEMFAFNSMS